MNIVECLAGVGHKVKPNQHYIGVCLLAAERIPCPVSRVVDLILMALVKFSLKRGLKSSITSQCMTM